LKQKIYRSDIIAFLILLVGYFVSFFHLLSYALGRKVEVHTDISPKNIGKVTEEQTTKSSKKSKRYNSTKVKKEKKNKNKEQKSTCK
jgi:hypothetical protein